MKIAFIACLSMVMVACTTTPKTDKETAEVTVENTTESSTISDIAYIDVEYILANSKIYQDEGAPLQRKSNRAQASWAQKEQGFQSDLAKLQEKYNRGLITTANAQAESEKIQQRAAEFQKTVQQEMQKLEREDMELTNKTSNLINRAVGEINADKKYKMIINASALIDADTTLNITRRVVEIVDRLYLSEKPVK